MSEARHDSDEALGRRLAADLPRYQAPARLRVAVIDAAEPSPRRAAWVPPVLAASASALAMLLFFIPLLPRLEPADPVERLVRAVVSEHSRARMWGVRQAQVMPAAAPWLTQESGIQFAKTFLGDERLAFLGAEPVYLDHERGAALHYRDPDGRLVTFMVLPAPELRLPDRQRVQIDRYRPVLTRDSGFAAWVWKAGRTGNLACFLVSDMVADDDLDRFKDYFIRVRNSTEPALAY